MIVECVAKITRMSLSLLLLLFIMYTASHGVAACEVPRYGLGILRKVCIQCCQNCGSDAVAEVWMAFQNCVVNLGRTLMLYTCCVYIYSFCAKEKIEYNRKAFTGKIKIEKNETKLSTPIDF